MLAVAAPAAAVLAVTKPGVGASTTVAGASGAISSGVAVPEVPTSAATSAVAAEAPVAWTPAGTPSVVRGVELEPVRAAEELPG